MKNLRQRFEEYFQGNLTKNYKTDLRDFDGEPYYVRPSTRIAWGAWVMSDAYNRDENTELEYYQKEINQMLSVLPKEPVYLDLPDGGNVEPSEQLRRYVEDLTKQRDFWFDKGLELVNKEVVLKEHIEALKVALNQLQESSEGVAGLHLNGDVAPWEELREGGRFEEWLMVFDEELEAEL